MVKTGNTVDHKISTKENRIQMLTKAKGTLDNYVISKRDV